ncbi:hypothetical protein VD17_11165 [Pseudomonas fluorescens]|uniref:Uncharacterized protein n=1 Tax=Pseudomonas fluorescens TaxID=294 RepID=A0A0F4VAU3_PSEFL|nr:hypothetical protein VD17_11165 [Pseudomonas fluorescens]
MQNLMTVAIRIFYFYRAIVPTSKCDCACNWRINFWILQIDAILATNIIKICPSMRATRTLLAIDSRYMRLVAINRGQNTEHHFIERHITSFLNFYQSE